MKNEILQAAKELQESIKGISQELESVYQIAEKNGLYKEADLIERVQFHSKFSSLETTLEMFLNKVCSYVDTIEQVNTIDIQEYKRVINIINQLKEITL